jgi:hypothetical protein
VARHLVPPKRESDPLTLQKHRGLDYEFIISMMLPLKRNLESWSREGGNDTVTSSTFVAHHHGGRYYVANIMR